MFWTISKNMLIIFIKGTINPMMLKIVPDSTCVTTCDDIFVCCENIWATKLFTWHPWRGEAQIPKKKHRKRNSHIKSGFHWCGGEYLSFCQYHCPLLCSNFWKKGALFYVIIEVASFWVEECPDIKATIVFFCWMVSARDDWVDEKIRRTAYSSGRKC